MNKAELMQQNFENCMAFFKSKDIAFETDKKGENNLIITGTSTEDLPIQILFEFDVQRQMISVYAPMPFNMEEDKLFDGSVAIAMINQVLVDGSFDYDVEDGAIIFRLTHKCSDKVLVPNDIYDHLMMATCFTNDRYNDKLFIISKGAMSLEGLYSFIHSDED